MEELRTQTTLFCAALALAIALSMILRGRRATHLLFAAFATDIALWYASQSQKGPQWVRATGVLTVLLPQFAVHLFNAVAPTATATKQAGWLRRGASLTALPMLVLVLSPYHERPLALGVTYFYVVGLLAAALVELARSGQRSPSRADRERVRFLVGVGALATTFTLADFLSFLGVHLPPIGAVLAIVFLFVLAESVTRPRLADLYDIFGRLLVATALAFCLAGIFYLFVSVLGGFATMYLNAVLAAISFIVVFEPLKTQVERRIHQFFFRERYILERTVDELRQKLSYVLEVEDMVEVVIAGVEVSRRATCVAIYLRDQEGEGFNLAGSAGPPPPQRIDPVAQKPIVDRLEAKASVSLEELAQDTRDGHRAILHSAKNLGVLETAVLLAVRGEGTNLIGIVAIADDRVRDAFAPDEVTLLESIAAQMSVVVANSRMYSRMKERDRLAAMGAMAAGLAHEVKNPLGAIKGAAQLLEEVGAGADPSASEFVGIIVEEVNRLDRVVGSFLDYARPNAGNPIPVDVNAAVRRTVQILQAQPIEGLALELELADDVPLVTIDPEKLRQVLMNLIQNSIQAMDGQGRVSVGTMRRKHVRAPVSERASRTSEEPSESVEVFVRDTGPGISQKVLKNLFIPFFTTKSQGTGLGLAISQSIIQGAGGSIAVQSHQGAGTTFTIVLPSRLSSAGDELVAALG